MNAIGLPEASWRRRLVYHGLGAHLPPESLDVALRLCDTDFNNEPAFSIQRFVERLCVALPQVVPIKGTLFRSLMQLRPLDGERIGPDPHADRIPSTPRKVDTQAMTGGMFDTEVFADHTGRGWLTTFNILLGELFQTLRNQNEALLTRLLTTLDRDARPTVLGVSTVDQIRLLAASPGDYRFIGNVPRASMNKLLHMIYLWSCDEQGPVEADRLFNRAIKSADARPETVNYPARSLL